MENGAEFCYDFLWENEAIWLGIWEDLGWAELYGFYRVWGPYGSFIKSD